MKILIVNYEYPPLGGGGGVATKQIAEELAKKHEVHVLTSATKNTVPDEITFGVRVHRVPVWGRSDLPTASFISMLTFVPAALWRGFWLCLGDKFDVLNAQFVLPSGLPAYALVKLFRIPFVLSFIGGDIYDPTKSISPHRHLLFRALIRLISRAAVSCTAISEDTKRRAQQLHGVTKNITVTPLGIVPQHTEVTSRESLGLPANVKVAVSVGRLIPRKGYEVLLDAWKDVPQAHLLIVGDGPLRANLLKRIKDYGLQERVTLTGFISEERKLQLLRAADMYVSAAKHEGFGIVFIEAMDAGLPLVAPSDGGQLDFLIDGENAILVDSDHPQRLAEAVRRLLSDEDLSQRMSAANAKKATAFYVDNTTRQFETVLQRAVKIA
ncbi:MAG: glycosyltransferase family 4 protein [Candidatus Andersenbacteria bacterium]